MCNCRDQELLELEGPVRSTRDCMHHLVADHVRRALLEAASVKEAVDLSRRPVRQHRRVHPHLVRLC